MKKILFLCLVLGISFSLKSQTTIQGKIISHDDSCALKGVYVWLISSENYTYTDSNGIFNLDYSNYAYKDSVFFYLNGTVSQKISIEDIIDNPIIVMVSEKIDFNFNDNHTVVKKPVIYLYPLKETLVNLKVNFAGEIRNTYPDYGNGWEVLAEPNGDLINQNDQSIHRYLFWDGENTKQYKAEDFKTGFIVKGNSTVKFLDSVLSKIGLNQYEKNDFISYWMSQMTKNEFNFVHFMVDGECDELATLEINPKPDSELRIYMLFWKTDGTIKIAPQKIESHKRNGFSLVEWGGIEF